MDQGKGAKWTRLSCRAFAANAVRLQLHALADNLGNFLRTLATPEPVKDWSLTSLKEKLIKIGAKVVSHGRYVVFRMAEVAIPTTNVPGDTAADRGTTAAATTHASMKLSIVTRSRAIDRRNASSQISSSTLVRAPELLVAIQTSRQSCSRAGKARISALVWESSGESPFNQGRLCCYGVP
jgi:hypothetical protein